MAEQAKGPDLKILHISDLHLSATAWLDKSDMLTAHGEQYLQALAFAVSRHRPNVVIISGDFHHQNRRLPASVVERLRGVFFDDPKERKVIIVPGNHDVNLDKSSRSEDELRDRFENYLNFGEQFYGEFPPANFKPFDSDPLKISGTWDVLPRHGRFGCKIICLNSVCCIPRRDYVDKWLKDKVGSKASKNGLGKELADKSAWIYFNGDQAREVIHRVYPKLDEGTQDATGERELVILVAHNEFVGEGTARMIPSGLLERVLNEKVLSEKEERESGKNSKWWTPERLLRSLSVPPDHLGHQAMLALHGDLHEPNRQAHLIGYGVGSPVYVLAAGAAVKDDPFGLTHYYALSIHRRTTRPVVDVVIDSYTLNKTRNGQLPIEPNRSFSIDLGVSLKKEQAAAPLEVFPRIARERHSNNEKLSRHGLLQSFISGVQAHNVFTFNRITRELLKGQADVSAEDLYDWFYPGFWSVSSAEQYCHFATHNGDPARWTVESLLNGQLRFIFAGGSVFRMITYTDIDERENAANAIRLQRERLNRDYEDHAGRLVLVCVSRVKAQEEIGRHAGIDLLNAALLVNKDAADERIALYYSPGKNSLKMTITMNQNELREIEKIRAWFRKLDEVEYRKDIIMDGKERLDRYRLEDLFFDSNLMSRSN